MPHTGRYRFTQDITLDERLARESHCTDLYTHCIQIVDRVEKLDWVSVVRPDQAMRATPNMVLILPGLRQADGIVRKLWSSVYRTGKVPKNKLFVEMLEAAGYRTQHDPNFQCSMVDDDFSVGLINNYVSFGSDDENSNPKLTRNIATILLQCCYVRLFITCRNIVGILHPILHGYCRNIASVAWILQGYCMDIAGILQQYCDQCFKDIGGILQQYCSNIASAAWILQEQAENLLDGEKRILLKAELLILILRGGGFSALA
ncbi:hypothetical protein PV328_011733 [Microctonus aethiopoides]|uniref:Uncharacterized protein n=1 Tax=Microctonus aethiopoides TaxID=144406 RepID=A0AA39FHN5_9HYME|nr:hypothetical protein PV328_011733 [Microctonus aethiopoides]